MAETIIRRKAGWSPRPGRYQCVLPKGTVHIDVFVGEGNPTPTKLSFGDEIELFDKELRILKDSDIMRDGLLAPIAHFKRNAKGFIRDDDGNIIEEPATQDPDNPNIISDDFIWETVQTVENIGEFALAIGGITSRVTAERFLQACKDLDTPMSYMAACEEQLAKINEADEQSRYVGEPEGTRRSLLTEKIRR